MSSNDTTAGRFADAYDRVDDDLVQELAVVLRDTGRYGGEAGEVAGDVLAALGVLGKVVR